MFDFNKSLIKSSQRYHFWTRDVEHPIKVYDCEDGKGTIHMCMITNVLFIARSNTKKSDQSTI